MVSKKILIITTRLPYPETAGFKKRILAFSKILKKNGYSISLFYSYISKNDSKVPSELYKIYDNIYPLKVSKLEALFNVIKSFISGEPVQTNLYYSKKIREALNNIVEKEKPNILFFNFNRSAKYISFVSDFKCRKIIDLHDAVSKHYLEALKEKFVSSFWKFFYRYEGKKLKIFEINQKNFFDGLILISPTDKEFLFGNLEETNNITVIPIGVDKKLLEYDNEERDNTITFIGKMNYYPNVDAVVHFAKDILPNLEDKNIKFYIIGTNPSKEVLKLQNDRIVVTGFVEDPYELISKSKLMIAPVRFGGGMQNKILEGMALGKTVITYEERAIPIIGYKNNENLVTVNNTEEFIRELNYYLKRQDLRKKIGQNARKLIEENYTWDVIEKKLINFIENIYYND
jgi:glycosyltransferase involved in cell wall biosynthesis